MTIEQAISKYEMLAKDDNIEPHIREEHKQIAEWLKECRRLQIADSWERNPDMMGGAITDNNSSGWI